MKIDLNIQGNDASEETIFSMEDWIRQAKIAGLKVESQNTIPENEAMGEPVSMVLSVVLASAAVVELVKSIHVWIKSTRPRVKIKVHFGMDKIVEIDAENLPNEDLLIESVLSALKDSGE
jgi:Effector Associated Constant Component 1